MDARDIWIRCLDSKKVFLRWRSIGDIQKSGRADERRERPIRNPNQVISFAVRHQASRLRQQIGIGQPGFGPNGPGSEYYADHTRIRTLRLVKSNGCPASTVSRQHYLLESAILGKVNPGGKIAHFLAGDTPVTTSTHSFPFTFSDHIPEIVHARIGGDTGKSPIGEGTPNPYVRWLVKVHSPAVDPDDRDGLGRFFRRSKHRPALDEAILRPYVNYHFRKLPGPSIVERTPFLVPNQKGRSQ